MKLHVFFLLFLSWGLSAQCAELGVVPPDQWPRFRGPDGTGKATTETLPASWTAEDWTWQADIPGVGHSSPVVWNEKFTDVCRRRQEFVIYFAMIFIPGTACGVMIFQAT